MTGATGWVGSAVVDEMLTAGHQVIGLARDGDKAVALAAKYSAAIRLRRVSPHLDCRYAAKGAEVLRATLDDLDVLGEVASGVDAVIHTAFNHNFSIFLESAAQDQRVIEALGAALEGSGRPLLVTSGLSGMPRGGSEADMPNPAAPRKSEAAARSLAQRGVRVATVRVAPSVHGLGDHGFVPILVRKARETGVSA